MDGAEQRQQLGTLRAFGGANGPVGARECLGDHVVGARGVVDEQTRVASKARHGRQQLA
jgi:hypothetical protein